MLEEAIELSKKVAAKVAELYNLPVFLYEKSATAPHRENLASVRKGEFEGMAEKIKLPEWQPDFGPAERHPTAGTVAIGARMPLVAYNINLSTDNMEIATKIAKNIRHINGGLRYVKAMGVELKERNITQVSINMTDYTRTALYRAFELVRIEARRYAYLTREGNPAYRCIRGRYGCLALPRTGWNSRRKSWFWWPAPHGLPAR